jgi:hypothetical protein
MVTITSRSRRSSCSTFILCMYNLCVLRALMACALTPSNKEQLRSTLRYRYTRASLSQSCCVGAFARVTRKLIGKSTLYPHFCARYNHLRQESAGTTCAYLSASSRHMRKHLRNKTGISWHAFIDTSTHPTAHHHSCRLASPSVHGRVVRANTLAWHYWRTTYR